MSVGHPAVFLDRDGTINADQGYVSKVDDLSFLDGVVEGLKLLSQASFVLVVVTNQGGIARGFHSDDDVARFHSEMARILDSNGVQIADFYHCPHHVDGTVPEYAIECECRKPGLALYLDAIATHGIDVARSHAIGDKLSDLEGPNKLGVPGLWLVDEGSGPPEPQTDLPVSRVSGLLDAARLITGTEGASGTTL